MSSSSLLRPAIIAHMTPDRRRATEHNKPAASPSGAFRKKSNLGPDAHAGTSSVTPTPRKEEPPYDHSRPAGPSLAYAIVIFAICYFLYDAYPSGIWGPSRSLLKSTYSDLKTSDWLKLKTQSRGGAGFGRNYGEVVDLGYEGTAPFQVVELVGRGKGLVATRDIQQGEELIREVPLILVPNQISTNPAILIHEAISSLPLQSRDAFYNLSYVNLPPSPSTSASSIALAIFQTNAVAAGSNQVGLFPRMARLNHACSSAFNSVYSWREREGVLVVVALRDIKAGEELLTPYMDTKKSRRERQELLQSHYAFTCSCHVCSLPAKDSLASDKRLERMAGLLKRFESWERGDVSGEEAIRIAKEIWDIGEDEGYWSERGRLAADAVWVAAAHSDAKALTEWAKLAERWYSFDLGRDSEQVAEMKGVVANPQSHRAWGSRAKMVVGGPKAQYTIR
ncbi:hypothetical protein JAAARDRAFT_170436 [Jaapia argillacea MUCL 33604]|uniref:SET domain-containing protein n=1 Tax=Jaapia argillacea MUCL 33604 TaxID=933084 RepID=A0A067Q7P7_9AGAM|nr:hypothetical protein JAAARDRAFT_170436 [Jaapia argillacea MUCL 33604]